MTIQLLGLAAGAFSAGLDILSFGRLASLVNRYLHIYGPIGLFIPFLASAEVFRLVEQVLWETNDAVALQFLGNQLQQINMVAVTGSVVAGVATSGLNLKFLSGAHWTSRAFILTSLLSGLFCVYYSMKQLRILGALITAEDIRGWLRSPCEKIRCTEKNRPSIGAVLILDTPRMLVAMSAISYVVGLSIYLVCVYTTNLDSDAGPVNSRNAMVTYFVALWFCLALYTKADLFDWYTDRNRTWLEIMLTLATLRKLCLGKHERECEDELPTYIGGTLFPPLHQPKIRQIPSDTIQESQARVSTSEKQNPVPQMTAELRPDSPHTLASSLPTQLVTSTLNEAIESRKRCIAADERFLEALKGFRAHMASPGISR